MPFNRCLSAHSRGGGREFARREHAVAAAERFGDDGYLTGWIAVRYEPDGLAPAQREDFEYGISCINTWVGEDGQDC